MTKPSSKYKIHSPKSTSKDQTSKRTMVTLSALHQDPDLWYRIHVLLHDLNNVKDHPSEKRLSSTTNELYISEPFFRDNEAAMIRAASVDNVVENGASDSMSTSGQLLIVEQALHRKLENFLEKRKASGDSRPCGPHDMVPIYSDIFGITKDDLRDERFLGRLARSGLGDSSGSAAKKNTSNKTSTDVRRRSGKKDKK